jgi:phage FluMu gp28-like protein
MTDAILLAYQQSWIKDEDKDITAYRIRFASGVEIWGLPSTARSLRSKQGRVIIDEARLC